MCRDYAAVVTKEGLYYHESLNSHEDIIALFGLRDDCRHIVRVEYCPENPMDYQFIEKYRLNIDQDDIPEWWEERKRIVTEALHLLVVKNIITKDRDVLCGGAWIIADGVVIRHAINARIVCMCGGTLMEMRGVTITTMRGGTITTMRGGTITTMWGGTIPTMLGGTLMEMCGGTITTMRGGTITTMRGGTIPTMLGGTLMEMCGGTITTMRGGTLTKDCRKLLTDQQEEKCKIQNR